MGHASGSALPSLRPVAAARAQPFHSGHEGQREDDEDGRHGQNRGADLLAQPEADLRDVMEWAEDARALWRNTYGAGR